jgi:hypothetical protein
MSDPAVGEIMPASVRALMIAACWRRRLGTLDQQALVNAPDKGSRQSYCVMMVCSSTMMSQ